MPHPKSVLPRKRQTLQVESERDYPDVGLGQRVRHGALLAGFDKEQETAASTRAAGFAADRAGFFGNLEESIDLRVGDGEVKRLLVLPAFADKISEFLDVLVEQDSPHPNCAVA